MAVREQCDSPKQTEASNSVRHLCVFCHGLGGSKEDWTTWVDCLRRLCPTWTLKVCESVTEGSIPVIGAPLDRLSEVLADEVVQSITEVKEGDADLPIVLHCVGHSMGGILLRGALPRIFESAPTFEAGVFMTLSCPHLGVQASWGAPKDMWRNLSWTLRILSPQIPQLAIQDRSQDGQQPYLITLATKPKYVEALRHFQRRICITMGCNDIVIPAASGSLWVDRPWTEPVPPPDQVAGWGIEDMSIHEPESNSFMPQSPATFDEAVWMESADRTAWFPRQAVEGLLNVSWERVVIRLQFPLLIQRHVFILGKLSVQGQVEQVFSKECVQFIASHMLLAASTGADIKLPTPLPCWMRSLKKLSGPAGEINGNAECDPWTVVREEGVNNVKFYRFSQELDAKQFFDGFGSSTSSHVSRIIFDPLGQERGRAGSNLGSFSTIHQAFVGPASEVRFDGSWIIAAEHGVGRVRFYHLQTEDLARQFLNSGFHVEARILFNPEGIEVLRAGWNLFAKYSLACAMEKRRRQRFPSDSIPVIPTEN